MEVLWDKIHISMVSGWSTEYEMEIDIIIYSIHAYGSITTVLGMSKIKNEKQKWEVKQMVSREEIWGWWSIYMFKVVVLIITFVNIRTQVISMQTLYLPKYTQ